MTYFPEQHQFEAGNLVTLFQIDARPLGATDLFLLTSTTDAVVFDEQTYLPIPIEFTEMQQNSTTHARPVLKVSNILGALSSTMQSLNDLIGAELRRIRTYETYLDGGATPDPTQFFGPDVFIFARKVSQNEISVEFEMQSALEHEGINLPRRQAFKDTCTFVYRKYDVALSADSGEDVFSYRISTCPYADVIYFDVENNPTADGSLDRCDYRLEGGCAARYGDGVRPIQAFPGIPNVR